MNAYVAVTDRGWFDHLRRLARRGSADEANFWTPKPWGGRFRALSRGQPLLFKLKSPTNAIAGGGWFHHYTSLPVSLAWDAFGEKNGAVSYDDLRRKTGRLRSDRPLPWEDHQIGCILLAEPFFWDEHDWFPQPADWGPGIQRGKGYDLTTGIGRELWRQVQDRLQAARVAEPQDAGEPLLPGGYADPTPVRQRVGQGIFRSVVTDVYRRRCAVTRERALPALEAAHIKPYRVEPEHYVRNGMLLRSDVHKLFDAGYVTVTPDYRVDVSGRMHEDFDDGENYFKLRGTKLWVPDQPDHRPDRANLEWHNENRFRGR